MSHTYVATRCVLNGLIVAEAGWFLHFSWGFFLAAYLWIYGVEGGGLKGRGKGRKEGGRHRVAVLGVYGCFALVLIVYCVWTYVLLFL